jgi:stage II sporulation protein D
MTMRSPSEPARSLTAVQVLSVAFAILLLLAGSALLTISCCLVPRPMPALPSVPVLPAAPPTVRAPHAISVLLAKADGPFTVSCPGGGSWYTMENGHEKVALRGTGPWQVGAAGGVLALNGRTTGSPVMSLRPAQGIFQFAETAYRGSLLMEVRPDGQVAASNSIPPEDYLRSVVGSEMYARWPMNALMAQAVAARTFLLYSSAAKGRLSLVDMAYKGAAAESPETDLAVELTRDIVMTYNGRLFPAYFSSTCGGYTCPGEKVFGPSASAVFHGVPCDWCRESANYQWQVRIPAARIAQALADRSITQVDAIEPQGTGADGYASSILVNGQVSVDAGAFRLAVGAGDLKSLRFTVQRDGADFVFTGGGYGHGVGLCQWGARGQAKAGRDWEEILHYYYFGVELQQME